MKLESKKIFEAERNSRTIELLYNAYKNSMTVKINNGEELRAETNCVKNNGEWIHVIAFEYMNKQVYWTLTKEEHRSINENKANAILEAKKKYYDGIIQFNLIKMETEALPDSPRMKTVYRPSNYIEELILKENNCLWFGEVKSEFVENTLETIKAKMAEKEKKAEERNKEKENDLSKLDCQVVTEKRTSSDEAGKMLVYEHNVTINKITYKVVECNMFDAGHTITSNTNGPDRELAIEIVKKYFSCADKELRM